MHRVHGLTEYQRAKCYSFCQLLYMFAMLASFMWLHWLTKTWECANTLKTKWKKFILLCKKYLMPKKVQISVHKSSKFFSGCDRWPKNSFVFGSDKVTHFNQFTNTYLLFVPYDLNSKPYCNDITFQLHCISTNNLLNSSSFLIHHSLPFKMHHFLWTTCWTHHHFKCIICCLYASGGHTNF